MAKRSRKRPSRHERDRAGCMWGLISLFDLRHGRSTRRLLSDRRQVSKQSVDAGHSHAKTILPGPTENCEDAGDADENNMPVTDVLKTSVKELMEEEMFNEQHSKSQSNDSEKGSNQIDSKCGQPKKNHLRKNRICNKSRDMDAFELDAERYLVHENFDKVPDNKHFDNLDLDTVMEELAKINQKTMNGRKHDFHGDLDIPSGQAVTVVEEKIVAAIKLFMEQRVDNSKYLGEEGKSCFSKEFADALQTLSSNKHLFLNLLKDPNSVLIERIQNLEDAQVGRGQTPCSLPGSNLSGEKPINLKSDEFSNRKHRNFFRRRSASLESYPTGGNMNDPSSSKIVILKPGPAVVRSSETDINVSSISLQVHCMHNKDRNERNTSQFSFNEIKRKLRHAMGKERQGISPNGLIVKYSSKQQNGNNGDKGATGENFLWSSPNRNHFYTERFAKSSTSFKKGEQVGKSTVNGSAMADETSQYPRFGVSNIYVEAKRHLSEMLNNGDEKVESMAEQLHKSLGRILSLPEYNSSPCCSPGKHGDDIFITAHSRLSPRGNANNNTSGVSLENHNNHPSPSRQDSESQQLICGSSSNDKVQSVHTNTNTPIGDDPEYSLEIQSLTRETTISEVPSSLLRVVEIEETIESRSQEEEKLNNVSSESSSNSIVGDIQNGGIREVYDGENDSQCLKKSTLCFNPDFNGKDRIASSPMVSPTRTPLSREVEVSECANEKMERPSPVSVLEPLFTDDDISPASNKSQPVEKDIQPRHIHFEEQSLASDHGICTRISLEEEESAFEYVEAVLLGSGLNWDEFHSRWLSLYEILDSSLFDEVELFSSRSRHDQRLLFDCANDALKNVCESYFGGFTGISCDKQNIRPVSKGMDLINEVWKHVEWNLFQHQTPHSLEQLVKRDMARSGKWMNLQSEIELIGYEMWKTIFDDLVEDTVLSFVDDTSDHEFKLWEPKSDAIKYIDSKCNQLNYG